MSSPGPMLCGCCGRRSVMYWGSGCVLDSGWLFSSGAGSGHHAYLCPGCEWERRRYYVDLAIRASIERHRPERLREAMRRVGP